MVEIQSRDKTRFVDAMMVHELGLLPDERRPILSAVTTFVAFLAAGSVPLLIYLINLVTPVAAGVSFPVSLALSGVALFFLGAAKVFVTARNWFRSGVEMLAVGGLAAGVAYLVGFLLRGLGG
jgi:VIT1/CCC1 family predicted Fe2+/Mn2+ transporter